MNRDLFISPFPGRLEPISAAWGDDWAFIPDALPPAWDFEYDLWPKLSDAKAELARLDGAGRHAPNPDLLLRPLQKFEALRSSSLEGTYATPQELFLFELDRREPVSDTDPANAWREVFNYAEALRYGLSNIDTLSFSLRIIRGMHEVLLSGVRGSNNDPGEFRRTQVYIGAGHRFIPPPPNRVMECLDPFERHINGDAWNYDPLIECFMAHYQFETIHPFLDGNGRVGRLLLSLMVFKRCGLSHPWLYLSPYLDAHKDRYIDALFAVSSRADWRGWLDLCLDATLSQARDGVRRLDALIDLRERWREILPTSVPGPARLYRLIDSLLDRPIVTVPSAAAINDVTYPTAKADVERLVWLGVLRELPDTHPRQFIADEVLSIAYAEQPANGA